MPPPRQIGLRDEPKRARPVPFCFHGFLPPPLTRPRVLVCARFSRPLARYALYASFKSSWFSGTTAKTVWSSLAAVVALVPLLVKVGTVGTVAITSPP